VSGQKGVQQVGLLKMVSWSIAVVDVAVVKAVAMVAAVVAVMTMNGDKAALVGHSDDGRSLIYGCRCDSSHLALVMWNEGA
jgi:hypothetical protein